MNSLFIYDDNNKNYRLLGYQFLDLSPDPLYKPDVVMKTPPPDAGTKGSPSRYSPYVLKGSSSVKKAIASVKKEAHEAIKTAEDVTEKVIETGATIQTLKEGFHIAKSGGTRVLNTFQRFMADPSAEARAALSDALPVVEDAAEIAAAFG